MDGSGYPRGLKGSQMSVQARIMAIADIFEALTAKDRPYKEGKKLSEALRILGFMSKDGHIDPLLFKLFIENKLYLKYAQEYLDPEQIDEVDPELIPGYC
jgi:HD-GYP domain-containing protein (c-di-GMP phosphodiesterase class II)